MMPDHVGRALPCGRKGPRPSTTFRRVQAEEESSVRVHPHAMQFIACQSAFGRNRSGPHRPGRSVATRSGFLLYGLHAAAGCTKLNVCSETMRVLRTIFFRTRNLLLTAKFY